MCSLSKVKNIGYCVALDMTARNIQDEAKQKGRPWTIAKGFDTFLPISAFVDKSLLPDPYAADVWMTVNNAIKQRETISNMVFRIPRILGDISSVMTLEEWDIVLTGTPEGVGRVNDGDVLRAGLKLDGVDIEEASLEVKVKDVQRKVSAV